MTRATLSVLLYAVILFATPAVAEVQTGEAASPEPAPHPVTLYYMTEGFLYSMDAERATSYDFSVYHGLFTKTNFGDILIHGKTHYEPSYITATAVSRETPYDFLTYFPIEAEGQIVRHTGRQKHLEFNGVMVARWGDSREGIPISFAFGEGLSFATRNPDLENPERSVFDYNVEEEDSRNLLNYLLVELELGLPVESEQDPRAFVRLHHRSGVFGLFCPPTCGSNFIAYGIKMGM